MTKTPRQMKDSSLLTAAAEVRGYLKSPHLADWVAAEYRATLSALESEIGRREI